MGFTVDRSRRTRAETFTVNMFPDRNYSLVGLAAHMSVVQIEIRKKITEHTPEGYYFNWNKTIYISEWDFYYGRLEVGVTYNETDDTMRNRIKAEEAKLAEITARKEKKVFDREAAKKARFENDLIGIKKYLKSNGYTVVKEN